MDIDMDRPIFLIGFMASGKTTVGRIVAAKLGSGWSFLDLDQIITDAAGRSVVRIFADEGEVGFRRRESEALRTTAALRQTVVATGGGAACREENLSLMLATGHVVALSVTPAEVVRRVGRDPGRPLLGVGGQGDPLVTAEALLAAREAFYARAHHLVDTLDKSPETVAEEVLSLLEAKVSLDE